MGGLELKSKRFVGGNAVAWSPLPHEGWVKNTLTFSDRDKMNVLSTNQPIYNKAIIPKLFPGNRIS